jgi:heme exporter protein C
MRPNRSMTTLALLVGAGMLAGLAAIFFWVPTEEFQGIVQRTFYVHVPAAWVAYLAFAVVLVGSIQYLRTSSERWDTVARSSAEVGVVFCGINIVTGMLWGKPIWGTYWQWDARLTSMFVLMLVYLGYLLFRSMATDPSRGARIGAVIGIVGFVDVPIVHFSVRWFRTLHPEPTVINPESSPQLPFEMLATLIFMVGVFTALYALILSFRVRLARLESQVSALESS